MSTVGLISLIIMIDIIVIFIVASQEVWSRTVALGSGSVSW